MANIKKETIGSLKTKDKKRLLEILFADKRVQMFIADQGILCKNWSDLQRLDQNSFSQDEGQKVQSPYGLTTL